MPEGDTHASRSDELTRFALLAQAVAGRRVAVVGGAGERAYTDGEAIFLPDDLPEALLSAAVVVQAALLVNASLDPWVMAKLAGRRASRLRYLTLEAARAANGLGMVFPARVSALVTEVYSGPTPNSPQQSLDWTGEPRRKIPESPEWMGTVKPIKVLRTGPSAAAGAPTEADRLGSSIEDALRELDDEEESERSRIMELFSAPIRNPLASLIQKFFGMGRSPGAGEGGGAELPVGGHSVGPVGPNAKPGVLPPGLVIQLSAVPFGRRYPEWDSGHGRYRPDWCAVAEFDPPTPEEAPQPIPAEDLPLRRQLARLGLRHERHRRQPEGDVLDLSALIELCVDRAAGRAGDERVYELRQRTAHDLGVLVLLDATGSTGESAEGRRVFDEQRLLAARLTAALTELGDRVATYGFYSRGREAVRFLRVKDFDDRYDSAAQRRLASLTPGGYTRLGAAIRHGTHVLDSRAGTSQMLLVLVGDGLPYEDGYEQRYAQEDSRRALREAMAAGVGCACVSVRSSTESDVLDRVWGDVPHRRLEEAAALAQHVRPLFTEALRTAGASRRVIGSRTGAASLPAIAGTGI